MKKNLFFLLVIILSINITRAQIPNGNFEVWEQLNGTLQPKEWQTTNGIGFPSINQTEGYNSNFGMQITNIDLGEQVLSGLAEVIFNYTERPKSLRGFYQLKPEEGDSVGITVYAALTNNNTSNIIGYAIFTTGFGNDVGWTSFSLDFFYFNNDTPDTAYVYVQMYSKNNVLNSSIVIDELTFSNQNTGINDLYSKNNIKLKIAPIPASEYINVDIKQIELKNSKIELYDFAGKKIDDISITTTNQNVVLNVSNLENGPYLLSVVGLNGERVNKKVIVSH